MNYILKNENAIFYECGYSCDNAIFLRLGSEAFFITDGRYEIEAKEYAQNATVLVDRDIIKVANELLKSSKNIQKLVFDPHEWSVADFSKLSVGHENVFYEDPDFSRKKRIVKTQLEIDKLSQAAKLGANAFDNFISKIDVDLIGLDELTLTYLAKEQFSHGGLYELSFDPIVAINANAAKPHARPTNDILKYNDLLLIDAGLKFERYCSDRTRTIFIDKQMQSSTIQQFNSAKLQHVYDTVRKAHDEAISQVHSGMKAFEVDAIARDIIVKAGYGEYFVHSTGHGVGLDIHELPVISSKSDVIIEDGMVFTIEPGIYLPDEFGVRIEDTVVMKDGRAEILGA
ncbi:MAG: M24 family metallopeptidase [Sulfurovaceae bacterium]|nr:M24 family metallopeptidase [Sulfurovaceae bacterium]